jgi:hypothetical protein
MLFCDLRNRCGCGGKHGFRYGMTSSKSAWGLDMRIGSKNLLSLLAAVAALLMLAWARAEPT